MIRHLMILACLAAFALSACHHDPPPDKPSIDAIHADDAAPLPIGLTADVTVTRFAPIALHFQVQPFDVSDATPAQLHRAPQPLAPRSILPHADYRHSDHARNASGRFTGADC